MVHGKTSSDWLKSLSEICRKFLYCTKGITSSCPDFDMPFVQVTTTSTWSTFLGDYNVVVDAVSHRAFLAKCPAKLVEWSGFSFIYIHLANPTGVTRDSARSNVENLN